jgi:serine/threonine-protein kinase
LLGQGQVSETYRARLAGTKPDDGTRFVIKVLRSDDRALAAHFVESARLLAALSLPACVRVVELSEGPGPIYAVWDLKAGVNLTGLRQQAAPSGPLDLRMVSLLGRKMAERLAPLHARSAAPNVHGGLGPGNVLVSPEGEVFFLECGLAAAIRPLGDQRMQSWLFAAPEQLRGEPATVASDLYALGALIHFMYLGQPPFQGSTRAELEAAIANGPTTLGDAPASLRNLLGRLLSYAPEERPRSAVEVARQIAVAMMASAVARPTEARSVVESAAPVRPAPVPMPVAKPSSPPSPIVKPSPKSVPEAGKAAPSPNPTGANPSPNPVRPVVPLGVAPFSLEAKDEPEPDEEPVRPFRVDDDEQRPSDISADDPDVGVVYDEDDEDDFEVGPDGKAKRRRRGRFNLPAWYRSEFARRVFRYWWVPVAGLLITGGVLGYIWNKQWQATRIESERKAAAQAAQAAREAASLKGPPSPARKPLAPGRLEIETKPAGATVWLDGIEKGHSPMAITTEPGAHRLVITLPGYRMLRDVVSTATGQHLEREMLLAPSQTGSVPLSVGCATEEKYPVFVDGKDVGALCPAPSLGIDPGRHVIGVFVIPQNRIWTFEREVQAGRPHRVQFNY